MTYYNSKEKKIIAHLERAYAALFQAVGNFNGSYIAGGCITSIVLDQDPSDYDVWFEDLGSWEKAVAQAKTAAQTNPAVKVVCETEHALTFSVEGIAPVFQLVKSRLGYPEEVVEQFDFLHAQAYYRPQDDNGEAELSFCNRNCVDFIEQKVLVFAGQLDYPVHTLSRLQKFAMRGYKVPDRTLAALIKEIRNASEELIQQDLRAVGTKYTGKRYNGELANICGSPADDDELDELDFL